MSSTYESPKICVAVAIAHHSSMHVATALSLALAIKVLPCDLALISRQGPYTHWNRERLVQDAQEAGASHVLFVDTDVVFDRDAILRLLAARKPIVGASYHTKEDVDPPITTIKMRDENGGYGAGPMDWPQELFQVAALGTGLMLIELASIESLERPLFAMSYENGGLVGEDVSFCRKAEAEGIEIWCDPTIRVGHIGEKVY